MCIRPLVLSLFAVTLLPAVTHAQLTVRNGTATTAAGITVFRDQFRTDLGGGTVAGANGSFGGVRREINWDGTPAAFSAPNLLPSNFFNSNSPRGVEFSTPGTSFMVSGATTDAGAGQPAAANFGNLDPSYTATFSQFTAQRLFTMRGSTTMDVRFFLPGTQTPATVTGFGVIFTDVDQAGTTALQFFDASGSSLGAFATSPGPGFSFLGAFVNGLSPQIARVRITCGGVALNAGVVDGAGSDVVVMDDFIYGEPAVAGACCHGANCTISAGAAACTGGTYVGNNTACSALLRTGSINACCPVDFNNTGGQTIQDIFDFVGAWFAGCP